VSVETLRVAADTKPISLAGAIAHSVRESNEARLSAIGAHAVNQAVKAIAIARGYLVVSGINIVCSPSFVDYDEPGLGAMTGILFKVLPA